MPRQLKAFISRSYAPEDESLGEALLGVVHACGIETIDLGRRPQTGIVSDLIKEEIAKADCLIAFVTLRQGAIPAWIQLEMAHAENLGKRLVLLSEKTVPPDLLKPYVKHSTQAFDRKKLYPKLGALVYFFKDAARSIQDESTQYDPKGFPVQLFSAGRDFPNTITVRQLTPSEQLQLSWSTVLDGMAYLHEQIELRSIPVNLIVGVNPSGMMLAAYLHGRLKVRERPLGIVTTSASVRGERGYHFCLPAADSAIRHVLLTDSELKSGKSIEHIMNRLREHYRDNKLVFYYAVLVGCGITVDSTELRSRKLPLTMPDLFRPPINPHFKAETTGVPDFLAFVANKLVDAPDHVP